MDQVSDYLFFDEYHYKVDEIMKLIKDEPKVQQDIFKYRIERYSYEEISIKMKMNSNSVRVIYFGIKNELKKQLKEDML